MTVPPIPNAKMQTQSPEAEDHWMAIDPAET